MRVFRTALAVGALAMSVPLLAQDSRYGWDRARGERSRDTRGTRTEGQTEVRKEKNGGRSEARPDARVENRGGNRSENRVASRPENGVDNRGTDRTGSRNESRNESRNAPAPDVRYERRERREERREEPRVIVRAPDMGRYDRRDGRNDNRYSPYGGRAMYRFGDRDFRSRDVFVITAWLRDVGSSRLTVYGNYDRDPYAVRYAFRPGLYLATSVFARLDVLPYELEAELGELPWYLERRIYGRTVLVVDVRSRMVVDVYDIDD